MTLETFFRRLKKKVKEEGQRFRVENSGVIRTRVGRQSYCPIEYLAYSPGMYHPFYYSAAKMLGLKAKDRDRIVLAADCRNTKTRKRLLNAVGLSE